MLSFKKKALLSLTITPLAVLAMALPASAHIVVDHQEGCKALTLNLAHFPAGQTTINNVVTLNGTPHSLSTVLHGTEGPVYFPIGAWTSGLYRVVGTGQPSWDINGHHVVGQVINFTLSCPAMVRTTTTTVKPTPVTIEHPKPTVPVKHQTHRNYPPTTAKPFVNIGTPASTSSLPLTGAGTIVLVIAAAVALALGGPAGQANRRERNKR